MTRTRTLARQAMRLSAVAVAVLLVGLAQPWQGLAQAPAPAAGIKFATISPADLKEWLTYISADELQGREVFTEGYGLAAGYVADHLRQWGVKPIGSDGTYFEIVKQNGYHVTRNSSVTVEVNGQSKTFRDGDHVTFPASAGATQTLTFSSVEFVGTGQPDDCQGRNVQGKLVMWMPSVPASPTAGRGGRGGNRAAYALDIAGAKGLIGYTPMPLPPTAA
jgi:hypothetical protein